jgi:peptidoglycan/LPS O-acetylase OafA/YrhL
LVVIFTVLNLLAQLVGRNKPSGPGGQFGSEFFDYWIEIYIMGGAAAAFEVLLPIAYVLILAPIVLLLARAGRWLALIAALAVVVAAIAVEHWGEQFPNLTLLSAGFLGIIAGSLSGQILRLGRYWLVLVAAYLAYAIGMRSMPQTAATQLLSASLALFAIFASCAALGTRGFSRQRIVMLGKYSLLSYIFQIAFLQVLHRLIGKYAPWSAPFFLEMIFVLIAMICVVEITNWLRAKNRPFAFFYNAVLG